MYKKLIKFIFIYNNSKNMYYPTSFFIDKSGYNEYIRSHAPKQLNKVIDELDEEDVIDGCRIVLPNNCAWLYDCLWLFDAGNEIIPVLIQNINSKSGMAAWSCGINVEEEEEISPVVVFSLLLLEELVSSVPLLLSDFAWTLVIIRARLANSS